MIYCRLLVCFQNKLFFQKDLTGTLSVSNGLDTDHNRHFVGSDLNPNCLQKLSADDKKMLVGAKLCRLLRSRFAF